MVRGLTEIGADISAGMPDDLAQMVRECIDIWERKLNRNKLRERYADGKNKLKDFGISIPPQLTRVETVVGWPDKAVEELAKRSCFDGFKCQDADTQYILDALVVDNSMKLEYRQAVRSELIHSPAFATLSMGGRDEPEVVVTFHSAKTASAVWDYRKKRVAYGIAVRDMDKKGKPTEVALYHDGGTELMHVSNGKWEHESLGGAAMGRPLMVPLVYRPTLDRPFGRSRVSRAVMSITDAAVRACLNADIASAFAASPQKYLLGIDKKTVDGLTKWEAYLGSIFAIGPNRNGDIPHFGQLPQPSMEPHNTWLRMLASRFAGETDIPVSSLGIIHDNPASAEAIHASESGLIQAAEDLNAYNAESLEQVARMAVAMANNVPYNSLTREQKAIKADFRSADRPSVATSTDSAIKIASVKPEFADTAEFWKMLGHDAESAAQIQAELASKAASNALMAVLRGGNADTAQMA